MDNPTPLTTIMRDEANEVDIRKPIEEQVVQIFDPATGRITREGMLHTIRNGGSVMHGHRLITTEADVPSEADFAEGDPAKTEAAQINIMAEMRKLQAQLDKLGTSSGPVSSSPTEPGGGIQPGGLGTGDTAGMDGDASIEGTEAHRKEQERQKAQADADKKAAAQAEKERREAAKAAGES